MIYQHNLIIQLYLFFQHIHQLLAGAPGFIQYWATAAGGHVFYNAGSEKM
jgi:hypothetical protein